MPCHGENLLTKGNMLQLISLVLVTCGCGLLMAVDGFIANLSSMFRPKSTLFLLPVLLLPKGNSQSPCPCLSIEVLFCLASDIILLLNCALPIRRSFNLIVTAGNNRYSILLRLVSVDLSVSKMDIWLALFLPNEVVHYDVGRLSRLALKWGLYAIWFLAISFCLLVS